MLGTVVRGQHSVVFDLLVSAKDSTESWVLIANVGFRKAYTICVGKLMAVAGRA